MYENNNPAYIFSQQEEVNNILKKATLSLHVIYMQVLYPCYPW